MTRERCYRELLGFSTFADRFRYLSLSGMVGAETFGSDRYLNQQFYRSRAWQSVRRDVIVRDNGCDLGIEGYEIHGAVYIHHMNPITAEEVLDRDPSILDPRFLISVTLQTHNAIHYGDPTLIPRQEIERRPGDTLLWKKMST